MSFPCTPLDLAEEIKRQDSIELAWPVASICNDVRFVMAPPTTL